MHTCSVTSVMSNSLWPLDYSLPGFSVRGIVPGKNTGVGCHFLLQVIFPTQESNPCIPRLLHWQASSLLDFPVESLRKKNIQACWLTDSSSSELMKPLSHHFVLRKWLGVRMGRVADTKPQTKMPLGSFEFRGWMILIYYFKLCAKYKCSHCLMP